MITSLPTFVDFFADSGLVTQGAKHACTPVWANDICPKKAAIYTANHGPGHFLLDSIEHVTGTSIPQGDIGLELGSPCHSKLQAQRSTPLIQQEPNNICSKANASLMLP